MGMPRKFLIYRRKYLPNSLASSQIFYHNFFPDVKDGISDIATITALVNFLPPKVNELLAIILSPQNLNYYRYYYLFRIPNFVRTCRSL